jgi:acyl-CoA hydrolase
MSRPSKPVSASRTEHVQILTLDAINGYNRLFGGRLMEWIDVVAAVVARRHSGMNVTTAYIDNLSFKAPAHANDTVILSGHITYAGKTSMEICVETFVENLNGTREQINKAYLIVVALDDNEHPAQVPEVVPETDDEKREYAEALKRRELRHMRKQENY